MRKKVAVVGLVALLWVVEALGSTLTIAIRNWDHDTLDPHISCFAQSMWMINMFTDTLVRLGPDGKFYPGLAQSWEMREGSNVWIFHLKEKRCPLFT